MIFYLSENNTEIYGVDSIATGTDLNRYLHFNDKWHKIVLPSALPNSEVQTVLELLMVGATVEEIEALPADATFIREVPQDERIGKLVGELASSIRKAGYIGKDFKGIFYRYLQAMFASCTFVLIERGFDVDWILARIELIKKQQQVQAMMARQQAEAQEKKIRTPNKKLIIP